MASKDEWRKRARKWQAKYNSLFTPEPGEKCQRCGHLYREHSDSFCMVEDCECDCFDWSRASRLCSKNCKRARKLAKTYRKSTERLLPVFQKMEKERDALLAWQRGVRDARREDCNFTPSDTVEVSQEWLDRLTRAIEAAPKEETHIEESPGPRCQNCRQNITWSGGSCRMGCAWFAGDDVVRCTFFEPKEEPC